MTRSSRNTQNVQSMTGFSSKTITLYSSLDKKSLDKKKLNKTENSVNLTITLKTLNSRFFETNFKLPYSLTQLETDLIKKLKSKLLRGTCFFAIHMSNSNSINSTIKPSLANIKEYLDSIKAIKQEFKLTGNVSLKDIISLPNIFENQEQEIQKDLINQILENIDNLISEVIKVREKEGILLKKDIKSRINLIKEYLKKLKPRAKIVAKNKKEDFFKSLEVIQKYNKEHKTNLEGTTQPSNNLVNQLDKTDIHEEITRFETHIINFNKTLESPEVSKGRKLDFTLQELFREINTICAKCSDNIISELAINIKVELEKAREQVQNIV